MMDLTFLWRSVCFFVLPNWFLCTAAVNDDTMIFLCCCGIPPKNLSVVPECVINVQHLSQLQDRLAAMYVVMPLVALRLPLVMIPKI